MSPRVRRVALAAVVVGVLTVAGVLTRSGGDPGPGLPAATAVSPGPSRTATTGTEPADSRVVGTTTIVAVGTTTIVEAGNPPGMLEARALSSLPRDVAETWKLVVADGPFPYDRDGATFENREGLLPEHPRGYYREYTVPTPGEDDRGARRLIVGGTRPAVFYTADHYDSFVEVDTSR